MTMSQSTEFGRRQYALLATIIVALLPSSGVMIGVIAALPLARLGDQFGWSKTAQSATISTFFLFFALGVPLVGILIRRHGVRPVVIAFGILYPLCLAAFALSNGSHFVLLAHMALLGALGAGASGYAYLNILPEWFDRRLGVALGVSLIGLGLGNTLFPVVTEFLTRHLGWRLAFIGLALINAGLVLPGVLLFFRSPDVARTRETSQDLPSLQLREAIRRGSFWLLAIASFLMAAAVIACVIYVIPIVEEKGFSAAQAALVAGVLGIAVTLSRPVVGMLLDIFDAVDVAVASCIIGAIGILILALATTYPVLILGAVLVGSCFGTETDILFMTVRRYFGEADFPRLYGIFGMIYSSGPIVGPLILGASFDTYGTRQPGLFAAATMLILAGFLLVGLRLTRRTTVGRAGQALAAD